MKKSSESHGSQIQTIVVHVSIFACIYDERGPVDKIDKVESGFDRQVDPIVAGDLSVLYQSSNMIKKHDQVT